VADGSHIPVHIGDRERDTHWYAERVISPDGVQTPTPLGVQADVRIDTGGTVAGSTGCGRLTGSAAVHGNRITFSVTSSPSPGCTGKAAEFASTVLGVLQGEVSYRIEAQRLTLTNSDRTSVELWART
jgi:heat shock protein HslJ